MSRSKLQIDEEMVAKLARIGASNRDIADVVGCDEGTIRKRFSALLDKSRAEMRNKLRGFQWAAAESGNVTMQIWLGKQELGQSDKAELPAGREAINLMALSPEVAELALAELTRRQKAKALESDE